MKTEWPLIWTWTSTSETGGISAVLSFAFTFAFYALHLYHASCLLLFYLFGCLQAFGFWRGCFFAIFDCSCLRFLSSSYSSWLLAFSLINVYCHIPSIPSCFIVSVYKIAIEAPLDWVLRLLIFLFEPHDLPCHLYWEDFGRGLLINTVYQSNGYYCHSTKWISQTFLNEHMYKKGTRPMQHASVSSQPDWTEEDPQTLSVPWASPSVP